MTGISVVTASEHERETGEWTPDNLRLALDAMLWDGIVVLEDVIDPQHLDKMNEFMVEDAKRIRNNTPHLNFGVENVQQAPPMHKKELFFDDFYLNRLLFQLVTYVLGPQPKFDLITGNTALPNSTERQPVHSDDKCSTTYNTFYVVANIPIIDFSPENGVTELWPATHRIRASNVYNPGNGTIKEHVLNTQRQKRPPVQPAVKKGSIVLRDLMLWHAGMPNPSEQIRCMTALGFSAKWWKNDASFKVPDDKTANYLVNEGKKCGVVIKPRVVDNYAVGKDWHDFELNEDPENNRGGGLE